MKATKSSHDCIAIGKPFDFNKPFHTTLKEKISKIKKDNLIRKEYIKRSLYYRERERERERERKWR